MTRVTVSLGAGAKKPSPAAGLIQLNIYAPIYIGNDTFKLRKVDSENSAIRIVIDVVLPPRCDQYQSWFRHDSNVTYLPLNGRVLLEVEGESWLIDPMGFFDIPAGKNYRFKGLEHQPVQLLAFASSQEVFVDWNTFGDQMKASAYTSRDGITRYR
jgi:mannose-6-phosphate isomerase-like protein (cupin superfamily)